MIRRPPRSTPLSLHDALPISAPRPSATPRRASPFAQRALQLARVLQVRGHGGARLLKERFELGVPRAGGQRLVDRKSTRLNSSHANISYAGFCFKKKTNTNEY